jgi:hypothetical protein
MCVDMFCDHLLSAIALAPVADYDVAFALGELSSCRPGTGGVHNVCYSTGVR